MSQLYQETEGGQYGVTVKTLVIDLYIYGGLYRHIGMCDSWLKSIRGKGLAAALRDRVGLSGEEGERSGRTEYDRLMHLQEGK